MATVQPSKKISKTGKVIHTKMDKTLAVLVSESYTHTKYKKTINRTKKYLVHDEFSKAHEGDIVIIEQSRPYSKLKHWILKQIVTK